MSLSCPTCRTRVRSLADLDPHAVRVVIVPASTMVPALRDELAAARAAHLTETRYLEQLRGVVQEARDRVVEGATCADALGTLFARVNAVLDARNAAVAELKEAS